MRGLAVIAAFLFSLSPVFAQVPRIEMLQVEASGFADPADVVQPGKLRRLFSRTPGAAVHKGTAFGVTVRPVGQPDGAEVTLRWIWKIPKPGVKDAKTGQLVRQVAEDIPAKIGALAEHHWEFREESEIVRGNWRVEVWNGGRRMAVRRFAIK